MVNITSQKESAAAVLLKRQVAIFRLWPKQKILSMIFNTTSFAQKIIVLVVSVQKPKQYFIICKIFNQY